jgi:hypothetical protein
MDLETEIAKRMNEVAILCLEEEVARLREENEVIRKQLELTKGATA